MLLRGEIGEKEGRCSPVLLGGPCSFVREPHCECASLCGCVGSPSVDLVVGAPMITGCAPGGPRRSCDHADSPRTHRPGHHVRECMGGDVYAHGGPYTDHYGPPRYTRSMATLDLVVCHPVCITQHKRDYDGRSFSPYGTPVEYPNIRWVPYGSPLVYPSVVLHCRPSGQGEYPSGVRQLISNARDPTWSGGGRFAGHFPPVHPVPRCLHRSHSRYVYLLSVFGMVCGWGILCMYVRVLLIACQWGTPVDLGFPPPKLGLAFV